MFVAGGRVGLADGVGGRVSLKEGILALAPRALVGFEGLRDGKG